MLSKLFQTQLSVQKVDYSTSYKLDDCLNINDDRANKVKCHKIGIPEAIHADKSCFVINHVLSSNECNETIIRAEKAGFRQALVNVGGGEMLMEDYRNSDRCIIDDDTFAQIIFERIKGMIPQTIEGMDRCTWKLKGLNERMRILRYGEGNFFAEHRDGAHGRNINEQSFLTIMIYLNDGEKDFVGGATNFIASPRGERIHRIISEVVPRTGMVLVFDHRLLHEGARLFSGKKYAIRTDVMYERTDKEGTDIAPESVDMS